MPRSVLAAERVRALLRLTEAGATLSAPARRAGPKFERTAGGSVCGASGDVSATPATHPKTNVRGARSTRRAWRNDWQKGLSLESPCYCDRHVGIIRLLILFIAAAGLLIQVRRKPRVRQRLVTYWWIWLPIAVIAVVGNELVDRGVLATRMVIPWETS